LVFSNAVVTLHFRSGLLAKNERSDFSAKPMFLPFINKSKDREHRLSCPVRALRWYLDRSQTARGQTRQLFITSTKPYRAVVKTTLAGWLVDVIKRADALVEEAQPGDHALGEGGKPVERRNPRAHSVRAYSTSWAFARGLTIPEIMNTVSWKCDTTFTKVYLRDIQLRLDQGRYATEVLKG
jgi:hypothetical protein